MSTILMLVFTYCIPSGMIYLSDIMAGCECYVRHAHSQYLLGKFKLAELSTKNVVVQGLMFRFSVVLIVTLTQISTLTYIT